MTTSDTPGIRELWRTSDAPPPKVYEHSELVLAIIAASEHVSIDEVREARARPCCAVWPKACAGRLKLTSAG
jgi:hypothetical protein